MFKKLFIFVLGMFLAGHVLAVGEDVLSAPSNPPASLPAQAATVKGDVKKPVVNKKGITKPAPKKTALPLKAAAGKATTGKIKPAQPAKPKPASKPQSIKKETAPTQQVNNLGKKAKIDAYMQEVNSLKDLLLRIGTQPKLAAPPAASTTTPATPASVAAISAPSQPAEDAVPADFVLNQRGRMFLTSFEGRDNKVYDTGFWQIDYPYWNIKWTFADFSNNGNGSGGTITIKVYKRNGASEDLIDTITSKGDGGKYLKGNGSYRVQVQAAQFSGWSVIMSAVMNN